MLGLKFTTIYVPILAYAILELFIYYSKIGLIIIPIFASFILFIFAGYARKSIVDNKGWNYAAFPIVFLVSLAAFISVLRTAWLIQLLVAFYFLIVFIYFKISYNYLLHPSLYKEFSLPNISSYGNFLSFFFIAAALYNFQSFLGIEVWILFLILMVFAFVSLNQILWVNGIKPEQRSVFVPIGSLLIMEIGWSVSFLPLSYLVSGFILSMCYYVLAGMMRYYLLEKLNKNAITLYLSFGIFCILLILLTSRWL